MGDEGLPTFIAIMAAAVLVIGVMVGMILTGGVLLIGAG
jgi:hypothetical protein